MTTFIHCGGWFDLRRLMRPWLNRHGTGRSGLQRREADVAELYVGAFGLETDGSFGDAASGDVIDEVTVDPNLHVIAFADNLVVVPFADRFLRIVGQVEMPPAFDPLSSIFDLACGADDPDVAG